MIDTVKIWTGWLATGVEAAAALVIAVAVLRALLGAGRLLLVPGGQNDTFSEGVRLRLARWLAVALEFALAADILRTAVAPSWDEIGKLAAIATLRTLLNFFLQREIEGEARARAQAQGGRMQGGRMQDVQIQGPQPQETQTHGSDTKLHKTLGVLASGASSNKYGLAQVEGNLGGVSRFPGIGAKPYETRSKVAG